MFKKMGVNVVCVVSLSVFGFFGNSGVSADQGGIDSHVKLLLHADGSDQGTLSPAGGGVGGGVFSRTVLPALKR